MQVGSEEHFHWAQDYARPACGAAAFSRFRTPVKPFAQVTLLSKVADQHGQRVSERSIAGYSNKCIRTVRSSGPDPQFILSKT